MPKTGRRTSGGLLVALAAALLGRGVGLELPVLRPDGGTGLPPAAARFDLRHDVIAYLSVLSRASPGLDRRSP